MTKTILIILILGFTSQLKAQNYDFPPNPKAGKCYVKCFDYEKKFEWKEIDCEKLEQERTKKKTEKEIITIEQNIIKLKAYQEKLKSLGYDVFINGLIDSNTIIAHNNYLKKKNKQEKRNLRTKKRKAKA